MAQRFHKMHGLGNDFVVLDARDGALAMTPLRARALADRHTGIGCDQLIVIEPSDGADAAMRIWNHDGSEVEACGNAARAVGLLIGDAVLDTRGRRVAVSREGGVITVDMGAPSFEWNAIPLAYPVDTARLPLAWGSLQNGFAVNVGNPHIVFFVDDVHAHALDEVGARIEHDPFFPARVNVNVAQVDGARALSMRTWERGVGPTRACGTGACATAVAAIATRRVEGPVSVSMPGGMLSIDWRPGEPIRMSGPATHVFAGDVDLGQFPA